MPKKFSSEKNAVFGVIYTYINKGRLV
jgi:hypothetical protein